MVCTKLFKHPNFNSNYYHYTTGREIIGKKKIENSPALRRDLGRFGLHCCDCDFYWLNSIIIVQRFTMVAEFEQ